MELFYKESKILLHRTVLMKKMSAQTFLVSGSRFAHQYPYDLRCAEIDKKRSEYPEYPKIIDTSEEGQRKHLRQLWYDSVKVLPSVEQKQFELAVQQKLDLKTYTITSVPPTYDCMNFYKYITRTHTINNLPAQFTDMNVDQELNEIRETLCETLLNYYNNIWDENKFRSMQNYLTEADAGSKLANSLILQCYKKLALRNDYVFNSTIQQNPRIFSFWWHGGYASVEEEVDERNPCFQYEDHCSFIIRTKQPLLPILDMKHSLCSTPEVIDYHFHPDVFQIPFETQSKVACIPGFWPGDPYEYPFLLVLTSDKFKSLASRLNYYDETHVDIGAAVVSSFALLNGIALYHGFSPFHDITYPFVTQTVVTNGQDWNFFVYQLNTVAFHEDVDTKDKRNLCWSSGKLRLFDTIEKGQVKGINDEVFKVLLKFLHNTPQTRENIVMKPYLGTDTRDADEVFYTKYLLRKMYTRVPYQMAHREEVPAWIKIYKLHPDAPPSPFVRLA